MVLEHPEVAASVLGGGLGKSDDDEELALPPGFRTKGIRSRLAQLFRLVFWRVKDLVY